MEKERIRNPLQEMYPKGFVIELGDGQYFQKMRKDHICCTHLQRARSFSKQNTAEAYIRKYFGYFGMETYICRLCWVLVSWEDRKYWDGRGFTHELADAVQFLDIRSACSYQTQHGLGTQVYLDYTVCRVQRVCPAA